MKDKGAKDIIMLVSACCTLASGIVMAFLSFFLSAQHAIHDSVLWYFAQCLVYAGSAFGIAAYVNVKIKDLGNIMFSDDGQQHKVDTSFHARRNDSQRNIEKKRDS